MILIIAGKSLKGNVTITIPSEQQSSVASIPTGGLGGNPPHSP